MEQIPQYTSSGGSEAMVNYLEWLTPSFCRCQHNPVVANAVWGIGQHHESDTATTEFLTMSLEYLHIKRFALYFDRLELIARELGEVGAEELLPFRWLDQGIGPNLNDAVRVNSKFREANLMVMRAEFACGQFILTGRAMPKMCSHQMLANRTTLLEVDTTSRAVAELLTNRRQTGMTMPIPPELCLGKLCLKPLHLAIVQ